MERNIDDKKQELQGMEKNKKSTLKNLSHLEYLDCRDL